MIKAIFIADQKHANQRSVLEAEVIERAGIVGDRNYSDVYHNGRNITFVELEEIQEFNRKHARALGIDATRRNIVTEGVRLNTLVGKEFVIGGVRFNGVELCEPCAKLGNQLQDSKLSTTDIIRAFKNKAGLRADALTSGIIKTGMEIAVIK